MRFNPLNIDWKFLVIDEVSSDPRHDVLDLKDQFEIAKQEISDQMQTGPIRRKIEIERVKSQILGLQKDLAELAVLRCKNTNTRI